MPVPMKAIGIDIGIDNIYVNFIVRIVICCLVPNVIFAVVYSRTEEFKYYLGFVQRAIDKIRNK